MPTYKHGDTAQISPHFKVCEFQCKCSGKHDFPLDTALIDKLEKLYTLLDCSQISVSSGYRCIAHDKAVGGSGTGQHTLGKAADICCYGKDGKPIVSYLVCCAAQDVGFSGIARINDTYTHVDVRAGKWYGDETKGNNYCIPCKDFYEYYNLPRKGESGMKGIDVSKHNGAIDWAKVKASGIQFVIVRAGLGKYAKQKDENFESNYSGAKAAGIPVGAYWYSYAMTPDEAREEARVCIEVLKGKQFEFPIWFDQEEKASLDTGKANCSAMVRAFCDELEKSGYFAGLYTSRAFLQTHIEDDIKTRYALWVAEWGDKLNYTGTVGIWQTGTCSVNGITGEVDHDICYTDYPTRIKSKGLNGYGKQPDKPPESTGGTASATDSITVEMTVNGKKYSGTLKEVK